jgi:Flp pilus assembly protein TadG
MDGRQGRWTRGRAWGGRFVRAEEGSATIEALIWLVAFFGLLILVTDASLAFYGKAQAFRIVQDGNRAYSVGRLTTPTATQDWVKRAIAPVAPNATAASVLQGGVISTSLSIPMADLTLFDSLGTGTVRVRAQHYVE